MTDRNTATPRRSPVRKPPAIAPFAVTRLTLTEFRSYQYLRLETAPAPIVLFGRNGAGKTNLLEAVSFLAPGRGLRRARLTDVVRQLSGHDRDPGPPGPHAWAVAATLAAGDDEIDVGTGLDDGPAADQRTEGKGGDRQPERSGGRRVVKIDGELRRGQAALAEIGHVSWLTPDMDRLFLDAASARRRFLDRLVYGFAAGHARHLAAYDRALRERARLLRGGSADPSWLGALETTMAESGVAVAAARIELVARLEQASDMAISGFPRPAVSVEGDVETWLTNGPALEVEDRLRGALEASRGLDAETGRAAHGPHRSDLAVRHLERDMPAKLCSTGEQKALLISLILAAARLHGLARGAAPILLLDEIAAHLDEARRAALFDEICALGAQAWLTGTDAALFEALAGRAQFFAVADGVVTPDA